MAITPFTAGTYVSNRNAANLSSIKSRLDTLSNQLSTQQTSDSYGGLGAGRTTSLSAHATLSALDGYDSAIGGGTTRVTLASASVTQVASLGDQVRSSLTATGTFGSGAAVDNSIKIAQGNLDAALDALNQQSAGRYLFGGRETDTAPVAGTDAILNGTSSPKLDGLKTLISERKAADGTTAKGNLTFVSGTPGTVTLSEAVPNPAPLPDNSAQVAANRANFGFILRGVVSSNQSAIQTPPLTAAGAPTVTPSFASQPKDGDLVRVTVNQPDGTQKLVDYTARTTPTPGSNEFAIGADATATAANLTTSLTGKAVAAAQSGAPPGISLAFTGGSPASASLTVSAPPTDGDTLTVTLGLRDGTSTTLTLTAKASGSLSANQFQISSDPAVTAQNIQTALSAALDKSASTTLSAASSTVASQDFFAGSKQAAFAPRRVDTANGGFVSQPAGKTVVWYSGDDTSADPRTTASVQVEANRKVGIGAQANEAPIRAVLSGIAALAAESFSDPAAGTAEYARYQSLAERSNALLTSNRAAGSIEGIASDLSLAAKNMADAKTQNSASRAVLQDSLDGIDTVDVNEVTVQLLALQNQLQASYQVTSTLSKLSLVNYLS